VVLVLYCGAIVMIWWLTNLAIGKPLRGPADIIFARVIGFRATGIGPPMVSPFVMDVGSICVLAILGLPFLAASLVKGTVVWRSTFVLYGVVILLCYIGLGVTAAAWARFTLN
jgi:hypothetical protein